MIADDQMIWEMDAFIIRKLESGDFDHIFLKAIEQALEKMPPEKRNALLARTIFSGSNRRHL